MPQLSLTRYCFLGGIVAIVFFWQLGAARLWDRDEPRNSRASHEMLQRGDWIVPTFNGELRDHKPILLYWAQMTGYRWLGESETTARLPSALAAALAVMAIAILASRLSGQKRGIGQDGFWAAASLATCMLFVMAGRAATPDALLIAFSTIGIASLVVSAIAPSSPFSSGRVGPARWVPALFGYTMLGLAALAKGPVGIVLPLAVVHLWWLVCARMQDKQPRASIESSATEGWAVRWKTLFTEIWHTFKPWQLLRSIWYLRTVPGLLICLLAAAPWYAAVGIATDGAFLRGFFIEHNVGRAMGSMEGHSGGLLFYPVAFLVGTFPWSLWLIPILLWARKASGTSVVHRQALVLAASWIAIYVTAFSVASTKLPSYITPCYAGAALAIGAFLRQVESGWHTPAVGMRWAASGLAVIVGISVTAGLVVVSQIYAMPSVAWAAIAGIALAATGMFALMNNRGEKVERQPVAWLIGAAAFQAVMFGIGPSLVDNYRSDLALLKRVDARQLDGKWMALGGMEPSWVHYLDSEIAEHIEPMAEDDQLSLVDSFIKKQGEGQIIAVGEAANRTLEKMYAQRDARFTLELLDDADRFLRPGGMTIYTFRTLPAAELTHTDQPSSPARVRAQTVSHSTAAPHADAEAGEQSGRSNESNSLRDHGVQPSNPLRDH